jgi:hypothetical protein
MYCTIPRTVQRKPERSIQGQMQDRRKVWISGRGDVVSIICPLIEIGLINLTKFGPSCPSGSDGPYMVFLILLLTV